MKHLLTFSLLLFTLSLHAAFTRLATETYPGGGGGPTGGVSKAYVDAHDLATLNSAKTYTDSATNALAASYASQLSYASQSATNYTDAATLAATNFVKAGYLPLEGGTMTGELRFNNGADDSTKITTHAGGFDFHIKDGMTDGFCFIDGTMWSTLHPDDTPVVTSNMLNGVLAPATNTLDTALRAAIDNEAYERQTADAKFLTKESTSYPATRNLKWSGYNLVLNGPMLFQNWDSIKTGTATTSEKLPEYITSRLAAYQTNLVVSASTADKVLKNDGTTLYWGECGEGGGITEETVTNIASSASITNLGSVAYTVDATNVLIAALCATNAETIAYSDATFQPRSRYQWVRPDDWGVDYTVSDTISTTTVISDKEDANLRVIRSETVKKTPTRNGQAFAVKLDPVSTKPLPMPTWNAVTPGIVINSDGTFTAAVDGLFRISATSGDVIRYADIAAQLKPSITTTNSYYYADKASTTRKTVNDAALATLNAATLEGAHTIEGVTFVVYNTFTPHMANVAAGNVAPFAVSPHVLACAHHYDVKVTGPITFTDGTSSASVTRLKWINLYDWAMTNGFTEAELSGVRLIRDIDMIICDKATAVPNACIPYFMSKATATSWFGADLTGISCWFLTRDFDQALPMVMLGYSSWASSPAYYGYYANDVRRDILTRLTVMGKQNPGRSGDSGRPVFIMKDGNPIVVAHAYSLGCGPDYVGAFPVIKAFVEWYGDTIKEAL